MFYIPQIIIALVLAWFLCEMFGRLTFGVIDEFDYWIHRKERAQRTRELEIRAMDSKARFVDAWLDWARGESVRERNEQQ